MVKRRHYPKARPSVLLVITWMRRVLIEPPGRRDCAARVAGTGSSLVPDAAFHKPPGIVPFGRPTLANSYELRCPIDPGGAHASHYVPRDCRKEAAEAGRDERHRRCLTKAAEAGFLSLVN